MKRFVKRFTIALAALGACGLMGCDVAPTTADGGTLSGTHQNIEFTLKPEAPVGEGTNAFTMTLLDTQTHQPVSGATVTLHTNMPAMGHQTNAGSVEEPTPGHYVLRGIVFDMPGDWAVRLQVASTSTTDEVEYPFNVP